MQSRKFVDTDDESADLVRTVTILDLKWSIQIFKFTTLAVKNNKSLHLPISNYNLRFHSRTIDIRTLHVLT